MCMYICEHVCQCCRKIEDLQFQLVEGTVTGSVAEESASADKVRLNNLEESNKRLKQTIEELKVRMYVLHVV